MTGLIDLPFAPDEAAQKRLKRRRRAPAAKARALDLPFASQEGAGARQFRNDCGPACVRMALDFLGLAAGVSIDDLQREADSADDGTTPEDLVALASKHGAAAIPLTLAVNQLPDAPAILLVRYSGFSRDNVENKRFWDVSAERPEVRHWMWWLGNVDVDGRTMSVWNDPLFAVGSGKNVLHTLEEFDAAFAPYFGRRIAVAFPDVTNAPQPAGPPFAVVAFDAGGVNFRREAGTANPNSVIKLMPQGARFTVLESAAVARVKLASAGNNFWLWVRGAVDGVEREGYVAAWLVRATADGAPPAPLPSPVVRAYSWQDVINAAVVAAAGAGESWQTWLAQSGFWGSFNNGNRSQPYAGPAIDAWPMALAHRARMAELLKLDSAQLVAEVVKVLQVQEQTAATRPRGAIIGVHGAPGVGIPPRDAWPRWVQTLKDMGVRWFKQCDDGDPNQRDVLGWATALKQAGIEPIIRFYCHRQFPDPLPDHYFQKMRLYAQAGITWAEIGNEPNLDYEWKEHWAGRVDFNNPECVRALAEAWVTDARRALDAGVRPALYAFAPTDWNDGTHPTLSSIMFSSRMAIYLAERRRAETIDIFRRGGWIAVHVATYDKALDFNPLPVNRPYWDMCLRGYEIIRKCLADTFGAALDLGAIPILSTEGGVFTPESTSMNGRPRLSTFEEHARKTVEMFDWLERNSPLAAMCPWCLSADGLGGPFDARYGHDGWFHAADGGVRPRPVVDELGRYTRGLAATKSLPRPGRKPALTERMLRELREIGIFEPKPRAARRPAKRK